MAYDECNNCNLFYANWSPAEAEEMETIAPGEECCTGYHPAIQKSPCPCFDEVERQNNND